MRSASGIEVLDPDTAMLWVPPEGQVLGGGDRIPDLPGAEAKLVGYGLQIEVRKCKAIEGHRPQLLAKRVWGDRDLDADEGLVEEGAGRLPANLASQEDQPREAFQLLNQCLAALPHLLIIGQQGIKAIEVECRLL